MKASFAVWLVLSAILCGRQEVSGPFELPARFLGHRFPQAFIIDCTPPLFGAHAATRNVRLNGVTIETAGHVEMKGKDAHGHSWMVAMDAQNGGCSLWRADLDRNGREDIIMLTADATSAGESTLTIIMIDDDGRPTPWQSVGYFQADENGIANFTAASASERAMLLYLSVEDYDRGKARATSLARYVLSNACATRADGLLGSENFPITQPAGSRPRFDPDLTTCPASSPKRIRVVNLLLGESDVETSSTQPLRRQQESGNIAVARKAVDAKPKSDHLVLSTGARISLPQIVIVDYPNRREIAMLDSSGRRRLIADVKRLGFAVRLAGRTCDSDCGPFALWASASSQLQPAGGNEKQKPTSN